MKGGLGLAVICGLALAGCSSAPVVREMRDAPTGIGEHEEIALLLATYGHQTGQGRLLKDQNVDGAELERFFDACLRREMLARREGLRFIPARDLREAAFPGQSVGTLHVPGEKILGLLADGRLAQHGALNRLRYVIVLDGTHWESGARPEGGGSGGGGAIGVGWRRVLSLRATVLDLAQRRVSGSISAYASGERAAGVGIVYIIPIPFFFTTMPEAAGVCRGLGRALVRFIAAGPS
jgi:hypothetical protein